VTSAESIAHSREEIEEEIRRLEREGCGGGGGEEEQGIGDRQLLKIEYLGKEWRFGRMIAVVDVDVDVGVDVGEGEGEGSLVFREERVGDFLRERGVGTDMGIGIGKGMVPRSASARLKERCRRDFDLHRWSRGGEGVCFRDKGLENRVESVDKDKCGERGLVEEKETRTQGIEKPHPSSLARSKPAPLSFSFSSYQWDGSSPHSPSPTLKTENQNYEAPAREYWKDLPALSLSRTSCEAGEVDAEQKKNKAEKEEKEREEKKEIPSTARIFTTANNLKKRSYCWESRKSLVNENEDEDKDNDSE
jgi:hypothetical protein